MTAVTNDGRKWIQASVAIVCMILGYIITKFFMQMGAWFDLESKMKFFEAYVKGFAVLSGLSVFVYLIKNPKTSSFMSEVYSEMTKVAFPDRSQTVRHTIGIMIGVGIVGFILGFFDFSASYLLSLVQ
jgi:preprotein translocase SecE subunit